MNEQQRTKIHAGQSGTVRAAIIGMGDWGLNLVNNVQGKSDVIRFVAGATRTPARAEEFSRKHGIPIQPSFEAVLADPSIDAVVLATPHSMHTEQIVAAARAGKHVFTEKPLGPHAPRIRRRRCKPVPSTRSRSPSATTGASSRRCRRSRACSPTAGSASSCTSKAISAGRASTASAATTGGRIATKGRAAA